MLTFFKQHNILLWKNALIHWRNVDSWLPQIMIPILAFLAVFLYRQNVEPQKLSGQIYKPEKLNDITSFRNLKLKVNLTIFYSPRNDLLEKLIKATVDELKLDGYKAFANSDALEQALANGKNLCGIEFANNLVLLNDTLPKTILFKIRFPSELRQVEKQYWNTHIIVPPATTPAHRDRITENTGGPPNYFKEGFLSIQNALSMAYIKQLGGNNLPEIYIQRYPHSEQDLDDFKFYSMIFIPICIVLFYLMPTAHLVQVITKEKENQLKEYMLIIGLKYCTQWLSWFSWATILFLFPNIILISMLKVPLSGPPVLQHTDLSILCLFFVMCTFSCICFAFLCTALFSKTMPALVFCILIIYLDALFYMHYIFQNYDNLSHATKIVCTAFFLNAACIGYYIILMFDWNGQGLQWNNIFEPFNTSDQMTIGHIMISLLVVGTITWLFCLHLEQVHPGKYGTAQKWNFLCAKEFWSKEPPFSSQTMILESTKSDAFENVNTNERVLLHANNLKKNFNTNEVVKGVNLKLYRGEVTILLGHNGAGKTTTIYMLTGMIKPTQGSVIINGYNIAYNKYETRKSLGICLQENVLFDDLTVENHLQFVCALKDLSGNARKLEIAKYLKLFNLEKYKKRKSKELSGGWKRKLCLSCAFCGKAKVLLLDEPTSGLDVTARRDIWNVIQLEKKYRTILLTTHLMEEADILGDRIAIMVSGQLQCYGTPFFLKKKFVSGYRLVCVKRSNCDVSEVTALLRKYIPDIVPKSNVGAELIYILPDNYANRFRRLLYDLESHLMNLNISGFGIETASLEDVFLKVDPTYSGKASLHVSEFVHCNKTKKSLALNRCSAMLLKRSLMAWYNPILILALIFLPGLYLLVNQFIMKGLVKLDSIQIGLTQYKKSTVVLDKEADIAKSSLTDKISDNYVKFVKSQGSKYKVITLDRNETFTDYILKWDRRKHWEISAEYIAAATISKDHITAWLNAYLLHTAPLTINLVHNAILKSIKDNTYEIIIVNSPLPFRTETSKDDFRTQIFQYHTVIFLLIVISPLLVIFPIKERVTRSKLIQIMAGIKLYVFWLTGFLFDLFVYILSLTFLSIIILIICDGDVTKYMGYFLLIMVIYGICVILLYYVVSFMCDRGVIAFTMLTFYISVGFIMGTMENYFEKNLPQYSEILKILFFPLLVKHLVTALKQIDNTVVVTKICQNPDVQQLPTENKCRVLPECCKATSFFTWERPGILRDVANLLGLSVICIFALIFIEKRKFLRALCSCNISKRYTKNTDNTRDEDVIQEEDVVVNLREEELKSKRVVLNGITKKYTSTVAVNYVSLCVEPYECFGLLGLNGAGKTTTFKIMTGDLNKTSGKAYICGFKLPTQMSNIYPKISYCPQFDGLLEEFTGEETLYMFCLIHGIPRHCIKYITSQLAECLRFQQHLKKPIKNYSGGTKRKLSTALAILEFRDVIFLDEPTTGMDPASRRATWDLICVARDSGSSLVLCSHSMDECEALCTRITIMVKGKLVCIGPIQHLKNRFATGLIIKVKLKPPSEIEGSSLRLTPSVINVHRDLLTAHVQQEILKAFPKAKIVESFAYYLTIHIPLEDVQWSRIFGFMEDKQISLNVDDYAIYQESLADIFLQVSSDKV